MEQSNAQTFTQEDKQQLANEVYRRVEQLNVAIQQAFQAGLNVGLMAMPVTLPGPAIVQAYVNEIIPFRNPKDEKQEEKKSDASATEN